MFTLYEGATISVLLSNPFSDGSLLTCNIHDLKGKLGSGDYLNSSLTLLVGSADSLGALDEDEKMPCLYRTPSFYGFC